MTHELDDTVCEEIDEALNKVLDDAIDKHPDKAVAGEMFVCLLQFAAELAAHGGASHKEFLESASSVFRGLQQIQSNNTDPNLN